MTLRYVTLLSLLSAALTLTGCETDLAPQALPEHDYFPLQSGHFVVYDVEETRYALNANPVTQRYQLKELTGPAYLDAAKQTAFQLVRSRRGADDQPWLPDSLWTARLSNNEAIRAENGQNIVKLIFPVNDFLIWNGNRHNAREADGYELRNAGQPYRVGPTEFPETVTVVAQDDSTLIALDKRLEVFARQVGIVYKETARLSYCAESACLGKAKIEYGTRQIYRLREHGQE